MPAQVFTPPPLGVGMLWFPELAALAEDGQVALDAVARDAQRLWRPGSAGQLLDAPTLLRCPGLPLATAAEHGQRQIEASRLAVEGLRPAWVSAPLGFLRAGGLAPGGGPGHTGLLLPPLQCPASVLAAVRRIEQLRRRSGLPVAFSIVANHLRPQPGEMADGDFYAAVADAAGCGIMLDLQTLASQERAGRSSVAEVLGRLPLHRVWEVQVAGSAALGGAMAQASLGLLAEWLPRLPQLGALVYDASATEGQPARAEVIAAQMQTLRLLWQTRGQATVKGRARNEQPAAGGAVGGAACSVELWERALAALVQGCELPAGCRSLRPLMSDPGLGLYRLQLQAQRSSLLAETLPLTWRALQLKLGASGVQALLLAHWQRPEALAMDEARHFARFLRQALAEGQVAVPHLRSVLDFEMACVEISRGGAETQVHCDCEPLVLLSALSRGEWPAEAGSATAPGRVASAPRPALEPSASA